MSSDPYSPGFTDPNARLLASVIPPPPPTLGSRLLRFITTRSSGDLRSVVRWSRSREGRACFLAALAGSALTLGFYRSESSSAASAGPARAAPHERTTEALAGANVRTEPLALTPSSSSVPTAVAPSPATASAASDAIDDAADTDDADDAAPAAGLSDTSDPTEAVRPGPRKAASTKSKAKRAKHSRKAKRQSAARASSRSKRAKAQRATSAGPLAAWLATQRSKDASSSKRR